MIDELEYITEEQLHQDRCPVALATGEDADTETCHRCGATTTEISLLIDGANFKLLNCSECDNRTWRRDGEQVSLDRVLADLSSADTRHQRDYAHFKG